MTPPATRKPRFHRLRGAAQQFRTQPKGSRLALIAGATAVLILGAALGVTVVQSLEAGAAGRAHVAGLKAELVERDRVIRDLEDKVDGYYQQVSAVETREATVETRTTELDARSAGLDARETAVGTAETAKKANSFGTGMFTIGKDVQPGTYQTAGTDSCYFARLRGTGGQLSDIIANGNPRGQAIVTIDGGDAAFKSQNCGTWTKIG